MSRVQKLYPVGFKRLEKGNEYCDLIPQANGKIIKYIHDKEKDMWIPPLGITIKNKEYTSFLKKSYKQGWNPQSLSSITDVIPRRFQGTRESTKHIYCTLLPMRFHWDEVWKWQKAQALNEDFYSPSFKDYWVFKQEYNLELDLYRNSEWKEIPYFPGPVSHLDIQVNGVVGSFDICYLLKSYSKKVTLWKEECKCGCGNSLLKFKRGSKFGSNNLLPTNTTEFSYGSTRNHRYSLLKKKLITEGYKEVDENNIPIGEEKVVISNPILMVSQGESIVTTQLFVNTTSIESIGISPIEKISEEVNEIIEQKKIHQFSLADIIDL